MNGRRSVLPAREGDVRDPLATARSAQDTDPELQTVVTQAAEALGTPFAVVCLASQRGARLHAIHAAADADVPDAAPEADAYCESCGRFDLSRVPADASAFEVRDVDHDERVPHELVARYGVKACLVAPVRVGGEVRGVLCAMDTVRRRFLDADRVTLAALAERASRRLAQIAVAPAVGFRDLLERAAGPAFGEIRNLLNPMRLNLAMVRATVMDLGPLVDALDAAPGGDAKVTLGRLHASFESFEAEVKHLQTVVLALEAVVTHEQTTALDEAVTLASQLSHHMTKLVGGLRWTRPPVAHLALARSVAVSAIAATISSMASWLLARRASPGLRGWFGEARAGAPIELFLEPMTDTPECAEACARDLAVLLANEPFVRARAANNTLCLELPRP